MNTTSNTRLRLTTQIGQAHVATGVPLDLGTNTQPSDPRTQWNTKPRVYRPTPVRPVSTTGQTVSYGPPWAHYLGGYQDRLLGGPLGLPGLRYTAPEGVEHKDYTGVVLG
jgi:hypothetical protein